MGVSVRPDASVTVWVWECEFKVITPSELSHSGWGEAAYPDFLTHYLSVSSLLPSHLPVTSPSLPRSLSTCYRLKRPIRLLKWPSPWWMETMHTNFPLDFLSSPLLPINLFSQLTCEGRMKANEGKQEIISNIKISLSKEECPFEMLYFSAGLHKEFKLD